MFLILRPPWEGQGEDNRGLSHRGQEPPDNPVKECQKNISSLHQKLKKISVCNVFEQKKR